MSIFKLFCKHAQESPNHPLLIIENQIVSLGEVYELSLKFATHYRNLNLNSGDSIGVSLSNPQHLMAAFYAALGSNLVPLLIAPGVHQERNKHSIESTGHFITDEVKLLRHNKVKLYSNFLPGSKAFGIMTSGVTGEPKAVFFSWEALRQISISPGLSGQYRSICYMTSYHIAGLVTNVLLPIRYLGSLRVMTQPFGFLEFLRLMEASQPQFIFLVPSLLRAMVHLSDINNFKIPQEIFVGLGSDFVGANLIGRARNIFPRSNIFVTYGMTEIPRITGLDTNKHERQLHSVGLPYPGVAIKIIDPTGKPCKADHPGEICVKGPTLCVQEVLSKRMTGGWLRTGDYGQLDKDGFLTYLGRLKTMFKFNGMPLFPEKIESIVSQNSLIKDVAVSWEFDKISGQIPVIMFTGDTSSQELALYCRRHLDNYEVPKKIIKVKHIPRTITGKIKRNKLSPSPMEQ